jgi:hypothetical protein
MPLWVELSIVGERTKGVGRIVKVMGSSAMSGAGIAREDHGKIVT